MPALDCHHVLTTQCPWGDLAGFAPPLGPESPGQSRVQAAERCVHTGTCQTVARGRSRSTGVRPEASRRVRPDGPFSLGQETATSRSSPGRSHRSAVEWTRPARRGHMEPRGGQTHCESGRPPWAVTAGPAPGQGHGPHGLPVRTIVASKRVSPATRLCESPLGGVPCGWGRPSGRGVPAGRAAGPRDRLSAPWGSTPVRRRTGPQRHGRPAGSVGKDVT